MLQLLLLVTHCGNWLKILIFLRSGYFTSVETPSLATVNFSTSRNLNFECEMDRKLTLKLILLRWKVWRMTDSSIISTTGISLSNVPDLKHCLCREIIFIGSSQSGLKLPSDCSWHCRNCSDCRLLLQLQAVIKLQWGLTPVCRHSVQCCSARGWLVKII